MRLALFVLLALTSACYTPPFEPARQCAVAGFGAYNVESARDCYCLARQADEARRVVREEIGASDDFGAIEVWVSDAPVFLHDDVMAEHVRQGARVDIVTARRADGLLHELLHEVAYRNGATSDAEHRHEGWNTRTGKSGLTWELLDAYFSIDVYRNPCG